MQSIQNFEMISAKFKVFRILSDNENVMLTTTTALRYGIALPFWPSVCQGQKKKYKTLSNNIVLSRHAIYLFKIKYCIMHISLIISFINLTIAGRRRIPGTITPARDFVTSVYRKSGIAINSAPTSGHILTSVSNYRTKRRRLQLRASAH